MKAGKSHNCLLGLIN